MTNETVERGLIQLVAADRIEIPISSMSGKLKRQKPAIAKEVAGGFNMRYSGDRVYARVVEENLMVARTLKDGVDEFERRHPKYGEMLREVIAEERAKKETHLYFGMNPGCIITANDYRQVMTDLGFTPAMAEELYPALMDVSRKLSRQRGEERSILIG